ncbi:21321_t:CDS:1, partial [Gigaspora rosea]
NVTYGFFLNIFTRVYQPHWACQKAKPTSRVLMSNDLDWTLDVQWFGLGIGRQDLI